MSYRQYLPSLNVEGKHLYVYSHRQEIWTITIDEERKVLSLITADRDLVFKDIQVIEPYNDIEVTELTNAVFFKPRLDSFNNQVFTGVIFRNGNTFKFAIKNGKLYLLEEIQYQPGINGVEYNVALSLSVSFFQKLEDEGTEVIHAISKDDKLFMIARGLVDDTEDYDYFYAIVDKQTGMYDKMHLLYSDVEDIVLTALNIDVEYRSVYLVGYIKPLEAESPIKPLFERLTF